MDIREHGKYTTIHRDDEKIVIVGKSTYEHIGLHSEVGSGSVFSGGITPDMINNFLFSTEIKSSGGGHSANFPGGGYLLVAPIDVAMQFENAVIKPGQKEERGKPVPVAAVHTTQPITDFATDETTALIFPYNPQFSDSETNSFIEGNPELSGALASNTLFALATAFPGGFDLDEVGGIKFPKQTVPRSSEWGGIENPKWAIIIPDSTAQPIIERWKRLAGTV